MTFSRALQLMLAGKEVRRPFWSKNARYKMQTSGDVLFLVGSNPPQLQNIPGNELIAGDWEEYVEPKSREDQRSAFEKWYDNYAYSRMDTVIRNKDLEAAFEAGRACVVPLSYYANFEEWYRHEGQTLSGPKDNLRVAYNAGMAKKETYWVGAYPGVEVVTTPKTKLEEKDLVKGSYAWATLTLLKGHHVKRRGWTTTSKLYRTPERMMSIISNPDNDRCSAVEYLPTLKDILALDWELVS